MKSHISSIEVLLDEIIPDEIKEKNGSDFALAIEQALPIAHTNFSVEKKNVTAQLIILCHAEHTQGTGRYLCDICSRWITPGKRPPLTSVRALPFTFEKIPNRRYFICEVVAFLGEDVDTDKIQEALKEAERDMRLTVMIVRHTRQTVASSTLSLKQKKFIVEENIATLLADTQKEIEPSLFDQTHHLLLKALSEKKRSQLAHLIEEDPQTFDTNIFGETGKFVMLLRDDFLALRDISHIKRLITYQYIFKKRLLHEVRMQPDRRHISVKLTRTSLYTPTTTTPIIGVTIALNLLSETELFEPKHLMQAIQAFIPSAAIVKDSHIASHKDRHKIFYIEFKKRDNSPLTSGELDLLKKHLHRELHSRVETIAHPLFMHRNEEEVMRNILTLSNQLKYVHDIPQVIVNFTEQKGDEIAFTVILVRIQKGDDPSVKELFHKTSSYRITTSEVKHVGKLRKRYPKEAHVFDVRFSKQPFLRKDSSLDLYKARHSLLQELTKSLGDIRDYNGGMISKQNERLSELRILLQREKIENDFLLETFFYSLTPPQMQSLLSSSILACLFSLLLESAHHDFSHEPTLFTNLEFEGYSLMMIATIDPTFIDFIQEIVHDLDPSFPEFATTHVQTYHVHTIGFVIRAEDEKSPKLFADVLQKAMKRPLV